MLKSSSDWRDRGEIHCWVLIYSVAVQHFTQKKPNLLTTN